MLRIGRGDKAPTPHTFSFTKKTAPLLRADFVLMKDPKWSYEGQVCGKIDR